MKPTFLSCFIKSHSQNSLLLFCSHSFSLCLASSAGWKRFQQVMMMGSRTGSLCLCPPPLALGCRWQACLLPPTTSSVSCLRIKWELAPSVTSPLHGLWVSIIPWFYLNLSTELQFQRMILFWHKMEICCLIHSKAPKLTHLLSDVCIPPHSQLQLIKVNSAQRPKANFSCCVINTRVSSQWQ